MSRFCFTWGILFDMIYGVKNIHVISQKWENENEKQPHNIESSGKIMGKFPDLLGKSGKLT